MRYTLRVSLLDRPGALHALTAALSRVGGDVVTLAVIDRADGVAVDDVCLTAGCGPEALRAAVEQVPGVILEALAAVDVFPDPGAPIGLAARVVEQGKGAVRGLVEGLPAALPASWCLAMASGFGGAELLSATPGAPSLDGARLTWLPLAGPRRLDRAEWMPPALRARMAEGLELAAAPLGPSATAVLVGRHDGPRFRSGELRQLGDLARVAVAAEMGASAPRRGLGLVPPLRASAGPAASAGRS